MTSADVTFRVTPEVLLAKSQTIQTQVAAMRRCFAQAEQQVNGMSGFWQGEAASAYRAAYAGHKEEIETILARLQEHVVDLNRIAGNYLQAEQTAEQLAETLPADIIV